MVAKKVMGVSLLVLLLSLCIAGIAAAEEKVAIIDPQKVLFQHPKFEQTQKQIKAMMERKQTEAKAAIDKETNNDKKTQIFQSKREEAASEERKLMEPLFKDIDIAIRTVASAKKLTIVVDKNALFFGGLDITDDVVQELKKKG